MVKANEMNVKLYEFDARVGLNGSYSQWNYPCIFNEENRVFFVLIGDVTIDKFNKTSFMNLVAFAEKAGAAKMVLIQERDHVQKGNNFAFINLFNSYRVIQKTLLCS